MTATYPLAVYTAGHGLEWTYPRQEISYPDLDRCRTGFGQLPDFDAGDKGFEGVIVDSARVFAVRCQNAPKRDFLGRDAIYLAVTWVSREEAVKTDFALLLAAREMAVPQREIPTFFEASAETEGNQRISPAPETLRDFHLVSSLVATLPPGVKAVLKRPDGNAYVSCRYVRKTRDRPLDDMSASPSRHDAPATTPVVAPGNDAPASSPLLPALVLSLALNLFLASLLLWPGWFCSSRKRVGGLAIWTRLDAESALPDMGANEMEGSRPGSRTNLSDHAQEGTEAPVHRDPAAQATPARPCETGAAFRLPADSPLQPPTELPKRENLRKKTRELKNE